jgi:hypothetical protein
MGSTPAPKGDGKTLNCLVSLNRVRLWKPWSLAPRIHFPPAVSQARTVADFLGGQRIRSRTSGLTEDVADWREERARYHDAGRVDPPIRSDPLTWTTC